MQEEQLSYLKTEPIALVDHSIQMCLESWFLVLQNRNTIKMWQSSFNRLQKEGLLDLSDSICSLYIKSHHFVFDGISRMKCARATKQRILSAYISFTRFLEPRTKGLIKQAHAEKGSFSKVRDKATTNALTVKQFRQLLDAFKKRNLRDWLFAGMLLQGAKRLREVMFLQTDQIEWDRRIIHFKQSKKRGMIEIIPIHFSEGFMQSLKEYVGNRTGLVFLNARNKVLDDNVVRKIFRRASQACNLPFVVTPHCLRVTRITQLCQENENERDILKITGHSSSDMIHYYDKTSREKNPSQYSHCV